MESIDYINRERSQFFYKGYKYNFKTNNQNGSKLFTCAVCKISITISENRVIREATHSHDPNALCKEINPSILIFDQTRMRNEFNYSIREKSSLFFTHDTILEAPGRPYYSI